MQKLTSSQGIAQRQVIIKAIITLLEQKDKDKRLY